MPLMLQAQSEGLQSPPARFPAALDEAWKSAATHSCQPGNAQLAIVLLKLHELGRDGLIPPALALIEQVKASQFMTASHPGLRGGIPASQPLWGPYVPYAVPNWGAKFLVDALTLKGLNRDLSL